jgi:hypothetical protein
MSIYIVEEDPISLWNPLPCHPRNYAPESTHCRRGTVTGDIDWVMDHTRLTGMEIDIPKKNIPQRRAKTIPGYWFSSSLSALPPRLSTPDDERGTCYY